MSQTTRNAFVLPSGNIFVYKGMLDFCENDDQLAVRLKSFLVIKVFKVVLGHEMAHSVIGHSAEKLTRTSVMQARKLGERCNWKQYHLR